jgi:hypothetical protein
MRRYNLFFIFLVIVSLAALAGDFLTRRGPVHDQRASDDLSTISQEVNSYGSTHRVLPTSLGQLSLSGEVQSRVTDYTYTPGNAGQYQLCTTFKTDTTKGRSADLLGSYTDSSYHHSGYQCLTYTAYGIANR